MFAWREGETGAKDADYFYEISNTEKEKIRTDPAASDPYPSLYGTSEK